jgi:hypothetical protein
MCVARAYLLVIENCERKRRTMNQRFRERKKVTVGKQKRKGKKKGNGRKL